MSPERILIRKLCNDLRSDLAQIDLVMKDYAGFHARYRDTMDAHLYRAVASFIAEFYYYVESIFTAVADQLDGGAPRGRNWHQRLLAAMAVEVPGVRPAVVSPELAAALTPLLAFRHVIPQAYGVAFDQHRLEALEQMFRPTRERFAAELATFCARLEAGLAKP